MAARGAAGEANVNVNIGSQRPIWQAHFWIMTANDPELDRLRNIEKRACALRDRLRSYPGLISDLTVLQHAENLCNEARAAVAAHLEGIRSRD